MPIKFQFSWIIYRRFENLFWTGVFSCTIQQQVAGFRRGPRFRCGFQGKNCAALQDKPSRLLLLTCPGHCPTWPPSSPRTSAPTIKNMGDFCRPNSHHSTRHGLHTDRTWWAFRRTSAGRAWDFCSSNISCYMPLGSFLKIFGT